MCMSIRRLGAIQRAGAVVSVFSAVAHTANDQCRLLQAACDSLCSLS